MIDVSTFLQQRLSATDREVVDLTLTNFGDTLEEALEQWFRYVDTLGEEDDDPGSVIADTDYYGLLDARSSLDDVLRTLPDHISTVLRSELLRIADNEFMQKTQPDPSGRFAEVADDPGVEWWFTRVPKRGPVRTWVREDDE